MGYPNVGKSSLINRLLKRRICTAAPRPGVTRELKYVLYQLNFHNLCFLVIMDLVWAKYNSFKLLLSSCDDTGRFSELKFECTLLLVVILIFFNNDLKLTPFY